MQTPLASAVNEAAASPLGVALGRARNARRFLLQLGALLLFGLSLAQAQEPVRSNYFRRILDQDRGLLETQVNAIAQTPDGYLWLGTRRGLVRYDGLTFQAWEPPEGASLPSRWVNALTADRQGRLWISTTRGLAVLDQGVLRRIPVTEIPDAETWDVLEDRKGRIWVTGSAGTRVGDGIRFRPVAGTGGKGYALLEDTLGGVWIGGRGSLMVISPGAGDRISLSLPDAPNVYDLVLDPQGGVWAGTRDGAVRFTIRPDGTLHAGPTISTATGGRNPVWTIAASPDGGIWLGTDGRGVLLWDGHTLSTVDPTEGKAARQVLALIVDSRARVWGGTGAGLEKYQRSAFQTYQADHGLPLESIWSIRGDRDGIIWAAAYNGGIYRYDGHRFITAIAPDGPGTGSIPTWPAAEGGIFAAPQFRRVARVDQRGVHDLTAQLRLPPADILGIYQDPSRQLWFSTDSGLFRSRGGPAVPAYRDVGLTREDVPRVLEHDSRGRMLLGRPGLTVVDSGRIRHYGAADGLTDPDVWAVLAEGENVWIGTADSGLYLLRHDRIVHLGDLDPRLRTEVLGIAQDSGGSLWFSSSYGLMRIPRTELETLAERGTPLPSIQHFDREDGLPTTEFNGDYQSQLYSDSAGRLWFPSYAGVVRVDPALIAADTLLPQIHLERVTVNGVDQVVGAAFRLPSHVSRMELSFTTTEALVPMRVRLQYRMDGVDTSWIDAGGRRTVSYGPLRGGLYRFRIRAANQDGRWTPNPATFDFQVRYRLHERAWFYPLLGAIAVGLVVGLNAVRRRGLEDRGHRLEQLVSERTLDLEVARGTLEMRVEERTAQLAAELAERKRLEGQLVQAQKLEGLGRLAGGVAHEINNSMTGVLGYAELAAQSVGENPAALEDLRQIRLAGDRVARITRQLLAFARVQQTTQATVRLSDMLGRLEESFTLLAGDRVRVEALLPAGLSPVRMDETQLEQVLINLVLNARDAMPEGGTIRIDAESVSLTAALGVGSTTLPPGSYVRLVVSDTGSGMTHEIRSHIFEPFFTTKGVDRGGGLGLAVCHGIVTNQGGAIDADSEPGEGTRMVVWMPVGEESSTARSGASASTPRGQETVLVVDDDPMVRRVAAGSLESLGYLILQAHDGVAALQTLEYAAGDIDLVLTDVMMPRMGGLELARALRAQHSEMPMLFMSGFVGGEAGMEEELAEYGAVLAKPFALDVLARAVRRRLDRAAGVQTVGLSTLTPPPGVY